MYFINPVLVDVTSSIYTVYLQSIQQLHNKRSYQKVVKNRKQRKKKKTHEACNNRDLKSKLKFYIKVLHITIRIYVMFIAVSFVIIKAIVFFG